MPSLVTERIESLKAGAMAACSFTIASLVLNYVSDLSRLFHWQESIFLAGIGLINGFLFGVTYRYIIRGDSNSHLQDGAVLAFALVRGLSPLGTFVNIDNNFLPCLIFLGESICCFAIARFTIDLALRGNWLQRYHD